MLTWLYDSVTGRKILKLLTAPRVSKAAGCFMDSPLSKPVIRPFARSKGIDLTEARDSSWPSFNGFFTRQLKEGARPVDQAPDAFISPCDGYLKVWEVEEGSVITVKDVPYTLAELLRSEGLAKHFEGGTCLVFRLTPTDYHRYIYPDDGMQMYTRRIEGVLHTVQPVATESTDVFVQNSREYSLLKTAHGGWMVMMEVGALLVGRIKNLYVSRHRFARGEEKGWFEFGGSTIVMLAEKDHLILPESIKIASAAGEETRVVQGEKVGTYQSF